MIFCLNISGQNLVSKSSNEVEETGEHFQRGGRRAHEVQGRDQTGSRVSKVKVHFR
jgi:hypothetical protein